MHGACTPGETAYCAGIYEHTKKVVLITGSSSGLPIDGGDTRAERIFRVCVHARSWRGKMPARRDQMRGLAASESLALEVCEMDVTDEASVNSALSDVIGKAGRLDG